MTAVMERVETQVQVKKSHPWWVAIVTGLLLGAVVVALLYLTVPDGNEGDGPVDALIVLGTPAGKNGTLTNSQRWRVNAAVSEFRAGQAPRIIFSGGPAANPFVEADVMAAYARSQGIPDGAIFEERRSRTTVENVANTAALLRSHGWQSVEVISTAEHLRRAAVLLQRTSLRWRVHPAATPGRSSAQIVGATAEEAFGTAVLRVFGTRAEPALHALMVVQHRAVSVLHRI